MSFGLLNPVVVQICLGFRDSCCDCFEELVGEDFVAFRSMCL